MHAEEFTGPIEIELTDGEWQASRTMKVESPGRIETKDVHEFARECTRACIVPIRAAVTLDVASDVAIVSAVTLAARFKTEMAARSEFARDAIDDSYQRVLKVIDLVLINRESPKHVFAKSIVPAFFRDDPTETAKPAKASE